ncbi:armadillo-type protein [Roridomyces roridus]|uniref:Armadillo-type protein n=1 Tax=Roridomyces roridus TaxID=1738132 RepID=A0AAD7BJ65_9AGAR|nr:armadillo-type protein [Roridomyces roridus]
MPPPQRVETPRSQASWWSDRNSMLHISPTMKIHAAAKPLMKFLYHRQALGIMEDTRESPLFGELLDIYSSYLLYKYVSPATRIVVLQHLERRARSSADDARAILCSSVLDPLIQLLTIERFRTTTYPLVGMLLAYALGFGQNPEFVDEVTTLLRSVSTAGSLNALIISRTDSEDVVITTTAALTAFSEQPGSATAVMVTLLDSLDRSARRWACVLVERLARRDPGPSPILEPQSLEKLVNLLRLVVDPLDELMIEAALSALAAVSQQSNGVAPIVQAEVIKHSGAFLDSTSAEIRYKTCILISSFAKHQGIVTNILCVMSIGPWLNLFLNDHQSHIRTAALHVLAEIAAHPDGATAIIEAKTLDYLTQILSPGNKEAGCLLLAKLRAHEQSGIQSNLVGTLSNYRVAKTTMQLLKRYPN